MVLARLPRGVEGVTETQSGAVAAGGKRKDTGDLCVETKVSLVAKVASKAPDGASRKASAETQDTIRQSGYVASKQESL